MTRLACAMLVLAPIQDPDAAAPLDTILHAEWASVARVGEESPHNAFTDLVRHDGRLYLAYREGRGHVSTDGRIRVLASVDGDAWEDAGRVVLEGMDLRDPKLSVTPDGRLMLLSGAAPRERDGQSAPTGSVVSFRDSDGEWSGPVIVSAPGRWLWRAAWHAGRAYGVAYGSGPPALLSSEDGVGWETVAELGCPGTANEVSLAFDEDGSCLALARRGGDPNTAMLGRSVEPYTDWEWRDLGVFVGGPHLVRLPSGEWVAGGRRVEGGAHTMLWRLDVERAELERLVRLPSGRDTSYPGFVADDSGVLVSYYSGHEGKTSVYFARVWISERGPGWELLFNGRDLEGWETHLGPAHHAHVDHPREGAFTVVRGADGTPEIRVDGRHWGALSTARDFDDFHLRLEYRWGEGVWPPLNFRDSGILYRTTGPDGAVATGADHRGGPLADPPGSGWFQECMEYQIARHEVGGDVGGYVSLGRVRVDPVERRPYRERSIGEWNLVEIECIGGESRHYLNGDLVSHVRNARHVTPEETPLRGGRIQLQSESAEVYFRNVEVRPIDRFRD